MAQRKIKITVLKDGTIKFDNAGNSDETRILRELSLAAEVLTGDKQGFEVEQHVHNSHTQHQHSDGTVHAH